MAFYNPKWKRYIKLSSPTVAAVSSVNNNASPLPSGWTHERFLVVDAGNGLVALHNTVHNGFLKVTENGDCLGFGASVSALKPDWLNEKFKVVDVGGGKIALFSVMWGNLVEARLSFLISGRYVQMENTIIKAHATAVGEWEEYTPVIVSSGNVLQPLIGHTIALHNAHHNRYLKMTSSGVLRTAAQSKDTLPRFIVLDAGNDKIGLYNRKHNRFVKVLSSSPVGVSPTINANSPPAFPSGWGAELLVAEDMGDGQIAIKGTYFNRYIGMTYTGAASSSAAGTWETFTVVRTQHALISVLLGRTIALHNAAHNRLLRMTGSSISFSGVVNVNSIPSWYQGERFSLVDAGDGKIALHTPYYNKFMTVQTSGAMGCSEEKDANQPLRGESLSFNAMDCGQGVVCLEADLLKKFVRMETAAVVASGTSTGTWERFTVVERLSFELSLQSVTLFLTCC